MTGYSKASSASAISTTDTLNSAIGKLEKALDSKGTSNLTIGTTSTTAAAGNHNHNSFYVAKNSDITGATKCKITYDTKGLVTSGADLAASDIPNLASSKITAMTSYSKPSSTSAITTSDSLNTAIGKLEKALEGKQASGSYSTTGHKHTKAEITDFPTIPTVNDGMLTIQKNGIDVATFTANQSSAATANITVPTKTSELTNDSGFKTTDTNTTYDLAASKSSTNGNVKVNLTAGGSGSGTDSVTIKGTGATTVTTDADGVVTISSTDYTAALNDKADKTTVENIESTIGDISTALDSIIAQTNAIIGGNS